MRIKSAHLLALAVGTLLQARPIQGPVSQKGGQSAPAEAETRIGNLEQRVGALEFWSRAARGADSAVVHVDSDNLSYAKDANGLIYPLKLKQTQVVPGVGVRYIFAVVNIYSITFRNINLNVTPIYLKDPNGDKNDISNFFSGPEKTATFLGDLHPGAECEVVLTMTSSEITKPLDSFVVMVSSSIMGWHSN